MDGVTVSFLAVVRIGKGTKKLLCSYCSAVATHHTIFFSSHARNGKTFYVFPPDVKKNILRTFCSMVFFLLAQYTLLKKHRFFSSVWAPLGVRIRNGLRRMGL